jgi:hypothetical protein
MANRLPRREQAKAIETPMDDTAKMPVRILQRERTPDKTAAAMIAEIGRNMRLSVWSEGDFAVSAQIDAPQQDIAPSFIREAVAFDP